MGSIIHTSLINIRRDIEKEKMPTVTDISRNIRISEFHKKFVLKEQY